jgi:hypothetical protein
VPRDDNVVDLPVITTLDIPAEKVLQGATEAEMQDIMIIGYDKDGQEYFASSFSDGGKALWMMERAKRRLMDLADGD